MRIRRNLVVLAAITLASGGSAAPAPSRIDVTIRVQPLVGICAGLCPDFEVTVGENRAIVRRVYFQRAPRSVRIYDLRAVDAAMFRKILAPLRPVGLSSEGVPCPIAPELENMRYGESVYRITWREGARTDRLLACYDERLRRDVGHALLTLRLAPWSGARLAARQAREPFDCWDREPDKRLC